MAKRSCTSKICNARRLLLATSKVETSAFLLQAVEPAARVGLAKSEITDASNGCCEPSQHKSGASSAEKRESSKSHLGQSFLHHQVWSRHEPCLAEKSSSCWRRPCCNCRIRSGRLSKPVTAASQQNIKTRKKRDVLCMPCQLIRSSLLEGLDDKERSWPHTRLER